MVKLFKKKYCINLPHNFQLSQEIVDHRLNEEVVMEHSIYEYQTMWAKKLEYMLMHFRMIFDDDFLSHVYHQYLFALQHLDVKKTFETKPKNNCVLYSDVTLLHFFFF